MTGLFFANQHRLPSFSGQRNSVAYMLRSTHCVCGVAKRSARMPFNGCPTGQAHTHTHTHNHTHQHTQTHHKHRDSSTHTHTHTHQKSCSFHTHMDTYKDTDTQVDLVRTNKNNATWMYSTYTCIYMYAAFMTQTPIQQTRPTCTR